MATAVHFNGAHRRAIPIDAHVMAVQTHVPSPMKPLENQRNDFVIYTGATPVLKSSQLDASPP